MLNKILVPEIYFVNTWNLRYKEVKILPSVSFSYNNTGSFIETGVYGKSYGLYLSFLIWEVAFLLNENYEKIE